MGLLSLRRRCGDAITDADQVHRCVLDAVHVDQWTDHECSHGWRWPE